MTDNVIIVGMHAKVAVSPTCRHGHHPEVHGREGVIHAIYPPNYFGGHRFALRFDNQVNVISRPGLTDNNGHLHGGLFTREELVITSK